MRAIDLSRRVAGAGGVHPKRDVFDPRNDTDGRVELLSLDAEYEDLQGQSSLGYTKPCVPSPADRYASAMDLESWLSSLPTDDHLLLALREGQRSSRWASSSNSISFTMVQERLVSTKIPAARKG